MRARVERFGALDSYVIDGGDTPSVLVILCHGFGAPGSDMVGVAEAWCSVLGENAKDFRFLCPIAPLSLDELGIPGGRAWWEINMSRLMQLVEASRFEELHSETPPGLDDARESFGSLVNAALGELSEQAKSPMASIPLVLGGFSQGAMLTMDASLRGSFPAPRLLFQFSGTVVCQAEWSASMSRLASTRIYQAHGMQDPILPFSSAERLRDLLNAAQLDVTFHAFQGPHTIDSESIAETASMLGWLVGASA
ncbi:MAG: lysophospholipase [Planctomycetota bacterium]